MGWDEQRSVERAREGYEATDGVTVSRVTRALDFEAISLKEPRRVRGAHVYVDVRNFKSLLAAANAPDDEAQGEQTDEEMLRRLHIYAREVARVVESDLDAVKVHFQGPRVHALAYRPVGDDSLMVAKAVLIAAAVRATASIFNEVLELDEDERWVTTAGVDFGEVTATKNGVGGDRELLFLGAAANHAAKILGGGLRVTTSVANLLPDSFAPYVQEHEDRDWCTVRLPVEVVESLASDYGWTWTVERTRQRLQAAAVNFPVGCARVHRATGDIDRSALGLTNSKLVEAVSVFADVDGFTAYIDQAAEYDPDLVEAVRVFHTLRKEMRNTAVVDLDALRVQYQGDRMQVLAYKPLGEPAQVALVAVRAAAALQSVALRVVPEVLPSGEEHPLAIGLAVGPLLLSKLGHRGDRDVVALGLSVARAAKIQEGLKGRQIGVDSDLYWQLPEPVQELFVWNGAAYVADDLTADVLERAEAIRSAAGARAVLGAGTGSRRSTSEPPSRPYHGGDVEGDTWSYRP